jgi:hypothetical protein
MLEVAYPHPDGLLSQCPDGPDVVLLSGSVSPHPVLVRAHGQELTSGPAEDLNARPSTDSTRSARTGDQA